MADLRLPVFATLAALVALGAPPGRAIVIRDDVPEAESIALGARYPATGHFDGSVACTLIRPRWAITAAHVAEEQQPFFDHYVEWRSLVLDLNKTAPHRTTDFYSADEDQPPKGIVLR